MRFSIPRFGGGALFLIVFLLFFAPWVSIRCGGVTIADTSGWNLALGRETAVNENAFLDTGEGASLTLEEDSGGEVEEWALVGLIVAWAGLGLTFVKGGPGAAGRALMAVLGVVALIALQVKIEGDLDDSVSAGIRESAGIGGEIGDLGGLWDLGEIGFDQESIEAATALIDLHWEAAYWAALILFALAALLQIGESPRAREMVRQRLREMGGSQPPPGATSESTAPSPGESEAVDPQEPPHPDDTGERTGL